MQPRPESPSAPAFSQHIPYLFFLPTFVCSSVWSVQGIRIILLQFSSPHGGYSLQFYVSMSDPPSPVVGMTNTSPSLKKQTTTSLKQQTAPSCTQTSYNFLKTSRCHFLQTSSYPFLYTARFHSCKRAVALATSSKRQTAPCHTQQATTSCKREGACTTSSKQQTLHLPIYSKMPLPLNLTFPLPFPLNSKLQFLVSSKSPLLNRRLPTSSQRRQLHHSPSR